MICRKCGAKLHERDRRPDGSLRCPDCGAVLRPRQHDGVRHHSGEVSPPVPEPPADLFDVSADGPLMPEGGPEAEQSQGQGQSSGPVPTMAQAGGADADEAAGQAAAGNDVQASDSPGGKPAGHAEPHSEGGAASRDRAARDNRRRAQPEERGTVTVDALFDVGTTDAHSRSRPQADAGKRRSGKHRRRAVIPAGLLIALLILALLLLAMIFQLVRRGQPDSRRTAVNAAAPATDFSGESDGVSAEPAPVLTPTPSPAPEPTPTPTSEPTPTPTPTPTAEPTPISVHFRAIGDVMIHEAQLDYANQGHGVYDFAPQFQFVKEALSSADYTIANLEFTISTDGHYSGYPSFHAPESVLDALKDCGIDLFTTANNHILDGYFDGVIKTNDELDERGFEHLGSYRTQEEANTPLVVDIKGIKVGFLAYTEHVNGLQRFVSANKSFCVKPLNSANFKADVQALRELGAELVICLPHWGTENVRRVNANCRRLALEMVDAGVDVILGSHPHMVQTMGMLEREVDGKQKNVLIAFSMGNFIANMQQRYRNNGIIVDFTVTREPDGTISVHDPGYVPVYVYNRGRGYTVLCSLEYYETQPAGMGHDDYIMLRQSVNDVAELITQDGIARLVN